ncbi:MAG: hypothetical protein JNK87_00920 [Bryobacterales bacterium]|nr:hypothetical protein [Bryobacterales bacterium]
MKALAALLTTPTVSTLIITLGVGTMLSISFLEPSDSAHILKRQVVGSLLLLLPAFAQKWQHPAQ